MYDLCISYKAIDEKKMKNVKTNLSRRAGEDPGKERELFEKV